MNGKGTNIEVMRFKKGEKEKKTQARGKKHSTEGLEGSRGMDSTLCDTSKCYTAMVLMLCSIYTYKVSVEVINGYWPR